MENVICVFNLACDPRQWFCCVRERHFCELRKLKKWKNWHFPLSWAVVQRFSVLSWQRWTCFSGRAGRGKLLTLIAKVTIITFIGGTWAFNFLLWMTCATERNWKPVLTFLQLYVHEALSSIHPLYYRWAWTLLLNPSVQFDSKAGWSRGKEGNPLYEGFHKCPQRRDVRLLSYLSQNLQHRWVLLSSWMVDSLCRVRKTF